jgi:hypothetical protein
MSTLLYAHNKDGAPVPAKYLEIDGRIIHDAPGKPYDAKGVSMMKTCFLSLLAMLLLGSVASARDPVMVEDRLVCEDTEVWVFTTCTFDPTLPVASPCIEQHFLFANENEKMPRRIPASGRLREVYGAHGVKMGKQLDALAKDWACLKGHDNESFVVIGCSTGGNCPRCEWYDIFDLRGRRLASSKIPEWAGKKEERRINDAFDRKYDALGLPVPWPNSSFGWFRIFEHPYKPE